MFQMKESGFTLIELVITTLIIGILSGVLIPFSLEAINRNELESTAKRIASDIRYGQNMALSRQTDLIRIRFVPEKNEYRNYFDHKDPGSYETVELPKGITLSGAKFGDFNNGNERKINFSARGTVSQGGKVSIHDRYNNWLFIKVTPVTGRVFIDHKSN